MSYIVIFCVQQHHTLMIAFLVPVPSGERRGPFGGACVCVYESVSWRLYCLCAHAPFAPFHNSQGIFEGTAILQTASVVLFSRFPGSNSAVESHTCSICRQRFEEPSRDSL